MWHYFEMMGTHDGRIVTAVEEMLHNRVKLVSLSPLEEKMKNS